MVSVGDSTAVHGDLARERVFTAPMRSPVIADADRASDTALPTSYSDPSIPANG